MDSVQNFVAWETFLISLSLIIEQILQSLTNGVKEAIDWKELMQYILSVNR